MSQNTNNSTISDKEMIGKLVDALQVLIDTPKGGPRSAGTWKAAETQALEAVALAQSRG
jgi:hypothetical protein